MWRWKEAKEPSWKNLWGAGDIAIIETIDLCFPRYDQLQWNNDISVLFWPIHCEGNLFCVTGGLQGTTQLMCARDQAEERSQLERQRRESEEGHYFVHWPLLPNVFFFFFLKYLASLLIIFTVVLIYCNYVFAFSQDSCACRVFINKYSPVILQITAF